MVNGIALVVFDLAGTTVEDSGGVLDCFAASMEAAGLRADREALNASMGQSKLTVLRELAMRQRGEGAQAEALAQTAFEHFRTCMADVYRGGGARPMRGAETLFAELREQGVRVALNTGFDGHVTDALLTALGWHARVDTVVCVDDVPHGRPAPTMIHLAMQRTAVHAVHEVAVVGDTPADLQAGANSGAALVVGVESGTHTAASLRRHPMTHLIAGVWELSALLRRVARLPRDRRRAGAT